VFAIIVLTLPIPLELPSSNCHTVRMKGVIFEKPGDTPKVVDYLEKPKPGPDQILVKSLWTAINPV
jgi:hypothetical protein